MSLEKQEGLEAALRIICFILREMRGPWRVSTRGVTWFAFCKEYSSCEMNTDKGKLYVGVQGTNSPSKRVAGEVVFPGEIHISSMKREKRMGMRGSLLLLEAGRSLRNGKGGGLTSEGMDEAWLQTEAEGLMCWMLIKHKPMRSMRISLNRASTEDRQESGAMA